ncbi:MAG: protein phosphatase 2C domain-containing protein [Bacteroidota bacterium]
MSLRIQMPQAIHEVGGRSKNEDSIWPLIHKASPEDYFFLVCDGVGGANKGEVASQIVSQGLAEYVQQHPPGAEMDKSYLLKGLRHVEQLMTAHSESNRESAGMATTLTLLYLGADTATIAWIGDSKVFQFRGGQLLYETQDHSLVEKLVQEGVISREEAEHHPQRNVILRAVKGGHDPAEMDIYQTKDIQAGDVFLLCSDGITENWSATDLAQLLAGTTELSQIKEQILAKSTGRTNDNFSAYLVEIAPIKQAGIPLATVVEPVIEQNNGPDPYAESSPSFQLKKVLKGVGLGVLGIFLIFALFILFRVTNKDDEVRHAIEQALSNDQYVEAMYYADALVDLDHNDPEQKEKYKELRDSVKTRLILWLNDSLESGLTLLGCQQLQKEIDTFQSKSLHTIQRQCERRLNKTDAQDWIEEGEGWWKDGALERASISFSFAQDLQSSDGLTLRKNILEKAEIGTVNASDDPLNIIETLEEANEDFEEEKYEQALQGFEEVVQALTKWGLDSLVNEKINLCKQKTS